MYTPAYLWQRRRLSFWQEAATYWKYIGRSGFGGFMILLLIVGSYYYGRTLKTLPTEFPYFLITTPLLLLAVASSPIRTFLREADRVFLLPAENKMTLYFRKTFIYSFLFQCLLILIVSLMLWPLYSHCKAEHTQPFLGLVIVLFMIKWASLLGSWQEGRMVHPRQRRWVQWTRWIMLAVSVNMLFTNNLYIACLLLFVLFGTAIIVYYWIPKHTINWDYLIQKEHEHLSRHYLFFSWFMDVPENVTKVKSRRFLAKITTFIPFTANSVYLYLFTKTFLRSELFGIAVRLTCLGGIFIFVLPEDSAKSIAYFLILFLTGIQMSTLEQHHRYQLWLKLYPVRLHQRVHAIPRIVFCGLLLQCFFMAIICAISRQTWSLAIIVLVIGVSYSYVYTFVLLKRKLRHQLLQAE